MVRITRPAKNPERPEETRMHTGMNEFLDEQRQGLTEMVENLRKSRVAAARQAAAESAARIRSLNGRVRDLARSGVRLTSISQGAVQSLIELQADIVADAIGDAASRLQRIAETESVRDLARSQGEVLQAARQRIVDDLSRAFDILKRAAKEARGVAERPAPKPAARRKSTSRKTATAARAPAKAVRRAAAKSTNRGRAKAPARGKRSARKSSTRARKTGG
jgi:phasin family protein